MRHHESEWPQAGEILRRRRFGRRPDAEVRLDKGLGVGDTFQVQAGGAYDMEVLLGEWPGGEFKAYLLIEKEGVEYRKDGKGNPILPIFKIAEGQPIASNGEAPVFDKTGPVWKAEKAPAGPSSTR